jgi:hypothetical protein
LFNPAGQIEVLSEVTRSTRALAGHLLPGVHEALSRRGRYLTLLRDPIDRMISHYFSAVRNDAPQSGVHHLPMIDFLAQRTRWHNLCSRAFASRFGEPVVDVCEDTLERAKQTLMSFEAVGITEQFDESLLLFAKRFGWRRPWYRRVNANPNPTADDELPAGLIERIASDNALDIELYRWARARFDAEIAGQGQAFRVASALFPAVNAAVMSPNVQLRKVHRRVTRARRRLP